MVTAPQHLAAQAPDLSFTLASPPVSLPECLRVHLHCPPCPALPSPTGTFAAASSGVFLPLLLPPKPEGSPWNPRQVLALLCSEYSKAPAALRAEAKVLTVPHKAWGGVTPPCHLLAPSNVPPFPHPSPRALSHFLLNCSHADLLLVPQTAAASGPLHLLFPLE